MSFIINSFPPFDGNDPVFSPSWYEPENRAPTPSLCNSSSLKEPLNPSLIEENQEREERFVSSLLLDSNSSPPDGEIVHLAENEHQSHLLLNGPDETFVFSNTEAANPVPSFDSSGNPRLNPQLNFDSALPSFTGDEGAKNSSVPSLISSRGASFADREIIDLTETEHQPPKSMEQIGSSGLIPKDHPIDLSRSMGPSVTEPLKRRLNFDSPPSHLVGSKKPKKSFVPSLLPSSLSSRFDREESASTHRNKDSQLSSKTIYSASVLIHKNHLKKSKKRLENIRTSFTQGMRLWWVADRKSDPVQVIPRGRFQIIENYRSRVIVEEYLSKKFPRLWEVPVSSLVPLHIKEEKENR